MIGGISICNKLLKNKYRSLQVAKERFKIVYFENSRVQVDAVKTLYCVGVKGTGFKH